MRQSTLSCIHCRYTKCLNIGMRPELVRGKRKKKEESRDLERENSESQGSDLEDASDQSNSAMSDVCQTEGRCY